VDHPFVVGEVFANRKGTYRVVSIDDQAGKMLVRYLDSGEDQKVSIRIQARIWHNLQLDERAPVRRADRGATHYQRSRETAFTGLKTSDFSTSIVGTSWRRREGLAGQVALAVSAATPYTFLSFPIYPWPVAFLTHRDDNSMATADTGSRQAKFTLEVDNEYLYYGLYVEKGDEPMDHKWDWPRLIQALKSDETLRSTVVAAESERGARFIGRMSQGDKHFHFANGLEMGAESLWDESPTTSLSVEERVAELESIPDNYWGEIYIIARMPKQEALDLGANVARRIARLFRILLPLYEAAVRYGIRSFPLLGG
jgi:hypothetical protein